MGREGRESRLTFREAVVYNMASFTFNVYDTILSAWIMYFYVPPEGSDRLRYVPIALMGIILAGGRILDAVTDPLVGYLSDHTRSRWGRRKPYIFVSNPLLFISFCLIWLPPAAGPSTANAFFLMAVLFVYYWAYTGVLIPWFAVLPEMRRESRSRVRIATIGVAIGVVGALVGGGMSGPLLERLGAFKMALILGLAAFVAGEFTLFGFTDKPAEGKFDIVPGTGGFFRVLKQVFADRQVLSFTFAIMLVQMTYQLMLMNVPYFTTLIMKEEEAAASLLMGKIIVIIALSTPLWFWLLGRYPKRHVFRGIMAVMATGFVLCFFIGRLPRLSLGLQAMIILAIVSIPLGGMFAVALGLIADLTDYDELKCGKRREAVYYGIYGIVRKTGWAACSLIVAAVFGLFGYSAENPLGVRVIWLVCAAVCLLGLIVFVPYRIGDSKEETRIAMNLG